MKTLSYSIPLIVSVLALTAAALADSLCANSEKIYFSCTSDNGKVVSLCGSPELDTADSYIQYRFGPAGKTPELKYPALLAEPKEHFESGRLMYSGGGGAYLSFRRGGFSYTVYSGIGKGWEKAGVAVKNGGKLITDIPCAQVERSELGPELFEQAGIPEGRGGFEIP